MDKIRWVALSGLAVVVLASGCGRSGGEEQAEGPRATSSSSDCDGEVLEATEVGVTADSITIQVMADTGSPLAPGLFQGNVDALEAFETFINDNGGIGCRELVVETWDSKLTPEESKNGQINACNTAVAMVGGNSLFNPDVSTINTCADKAGQPTGIPNIAALANDINEQCSLNSFIIQGTSEPCNPDGTPPTGERDLLAFIGQIEYYKTVEPNLTGLFMVPGDLPTTVQSATYQIVAQEQAGVDFVGAYKVSGRAEQSAYTPLVQQARNGNVNYVYNGSNDVAMTNMRREAAAQGLTDVAIWACSLACYTQKFQDAGADVQDTYVWMQFIPFEEQGTNQALDDYLSSVETPDSFGAQAWMAALLFQEAVNQIVEEEGPNAITRAKLLETLNGIDSFDAGGWMGAKDPKGGFSDCMVIMQMGADGFERVFPEEPGTLECNPDAVTTVRLDPAVAAGTIQ
jgi:ABC-type branched-subunit amino acid transport system substrate-binding protein